MPVTYDFRGRTAIVTGGANGIGRSIAERLRDAGADVIIWDIRKTDSAGVSFTRVDVTQASSIEKGLAAILERHRTVDVLVNNAGFVGSATPVLEFAPSEWRRSIEVNLISFFEVCRLVVPVMLRAGYGRVVNMASIAGKDGSPNLSAYAAAKAGVIAFTKSLAKEIALSNVRVNAIAPAAIDTEILQQLTPEDVQSLIVKSPMKRLGTVEEVAALALWLCSEDCSFSTGATFDLSGGRAVY
jgi:3-oxoacyl-[acyl-carrier protein] reductase